VKYIDPALTVIMEISLSLPEHLVSEVGEPYLVEALVATLYRNGKLTGKEAREMLGLSRRAFEAMLPKHGFSILVDDEENAAIELAASRA
jgi:hypothetical protein